MHPQNGEFIGIKTTTIASIKMKCSSRDARVGVLSIPCDWNGRYMFFDIKLPLFNPHKK